jgi:hypothetical protein
MFVGGMVVEDPDGRLWTITLTHRGTAGRNSELTSVRMSRSSSLKYAIDPSRRRIVAPDVAAPSSPSMRTSSAGEVSQ